MRELYECNSAYHYILRPRLVIYYMTYILHYFNRKSNISLYFKASITKPISSLDYRTLSVDSSTSLILPLDEWYIVLFMREQVTCVCIAHKFNLLTSHLLVKL